MRPFATDPLLELALGPWEVMPRITFPGHDDPLEVRRCGVCDGEHRVVWSGGFALVPCPDAVTVFGMYDEEHYWSGRELAAFITNQQARALHRQLTHEMLTGSTANYVTCPVTVTRPAPSPLGRSPLAFPDWPCGELVPIHGPQIPGTVLEMRCPRGHTFSHEVSA